MKTQALDHLQGVISRADLLRVLAVHAREQLTLDDDGEHWFGYIKQPEPTVSVGKTEESSNASTEQGKSRDTGYKLPLQMPFVHVIADRQPRHLPEQDQDSTVSKPQFEPITEDRAKPPSAQRLVSYQDLVPQARLLPALRRQLGSNRLGSLDLNRLTQSIALQEMPRHLPRRRMQSWHPELVVVLDFCQRLWPYREDMHRLAERLLRQCGRSGLSLRIVNHGPLGTWSNWLAHQNPNTFEQPQERPWQMPPVGTPVLIVSDLGLLEGAQSGPGRIWQQFIKQLLKAQTRPLALLPLGAEQLDASLPTALTLLRWSPDARSRPERACGKGQPIPPGLADLLAMASVTRRVDPPLLRAMRKLNPQAPLNAGLEGALWVHADVEAGFTATLKPDAKAQHQQHFAAQLKDYQVAVEKLRHNHHAHLRAALNYEEILLWRAHADVATADLLPETQQRIAEAEKFMGNLAASLQKPDSLHTESVWWQVAQDIVQRADNEMGACYKHLLTPLVAAIADASGDLAQVPNWIDPAILSHELMGITASCWLVRDPVNQALALQRISPNWPQQNSIGEPLIIDSGGVRVNCADKSYWLPLPQTINLICQLNDDSIYKLTTRFEILTIATVPRPRGAIAWGCDYDGVWVRTPPLCNRGHVWKDSFLKTVLTESGKYQLQDNLPSDQIDPQGIDEAYITYDYTEKTASNVRFVMDEYGVRADLNLITPSDNLIQSFRWIEPGTFLMGSPYDEPERNENEGPQHEVTISKGFWLAETVCTQALWQAVMDGNNPSHFNDDLNQPVEQVSWHTVQTFLKRLQMLLPGCQVDLPSEAEWEYTCRAGTKTPFSFGANISPQQVNYRGDFPYAGGEKGKYREKTLPVKNLPANPWGLYEMHGNIFEWCKDGRRNYDEQAQIDPLGPLENSDLPRVARGGSWNRIAKTVRSANRSADHPGIEGSILGFRVCLRSIESGQEQVGPAGSPGRASGTSPDAVNTKVKSSKKNVPSKVGSLQKRKPKPKR